MASNDEQRSATTIFTTAAQSIAARLIANKTTAKFTKAEISTTNLFNQSVTELQVLTSLDNVQQTADINTVTVINNNTVNVNVAIDQTKAPNDYQMNSVGLFAVDGDGKEVLYSVTVLKDPVYIHQDAMGSALGIDLETVVGQSSNVDLSINPAGAVTNEALKVTLADYVKTDDVKSLIPATVIDGSKPADFKEAVTLEKGAVDGAGNAVATIKDLAGGDAETLKSAKDYADTKISGKADDSKVVHTSDMRKPASDVAGIEEVNAKQDKLTITPADDSKVAHLSGANNFDTIPTVKNSPLLLASSLPSDLARLSQDANFTAKLQQNGQDVALTNNTIACNPNTGVVSTPTDFTKLTVNGGKSVATSDDLKSIENSAWRQLDATKIKLSSGQIYPGSYVLYKLDTTTNRLYFIFAANLENNTSIRLSLDFSNVVKNISTPSLEGFSNEYMQNNANALYTLNVSNNLVSIASYYGYCASQYSTYTVNGSDEYNYCFVNYDELV